MLDTIILQIPLDISRVTDFSQFQITKFEILTTRRSFAKWVNNPTPSEKKQGNYRPRLTILKRARALFLKIEFSAPKMLFGNNLEEVGKKDFGLLVEKLRTGIGVKGVVLSHEEIENALVLSFHPSKNIVLSGGYTADFVIKELYKANINKTFDLADTKFINVGQSLQIYTNSHSFVVYDKIADMGKPAKRAIDKDRTAKQMTIFDNLKGQNRKLEVVRFEVRLSKAVKMRSVLGKIEYLDRSPVLKEIFYEDLCQRLIMDYWDKFFGSSSFIFSTDTKPQHMLRDILMADPKIKAGKAAQLTGLKLLCKDEEGIRGLRAVIEGLRGRDAWTSINREIKRLGVLKSGNLHGFVGQIRQGLKVFKALKMVDLPCKEL